MLEEPLPNGDTTDRNKQLVRDDFNVFTITKTPFGEDTISAQLLKEAISVQPVLQQNSRPRNKIQRKLPK